jgi:hypothetical protein
LKCNQNFTPCQTSSAALASKKVAKTKIREQKCMPVQMRETKMPLISGSAHKS